MTFLAPLHHGAKALALGLLLLLPGAAASDPTRFEKQCAEIASQAGKVPDGARLHDLFVRYWEYRMNEFPEEATYNGYPGQNGRWTDMSLQAIERRGRETKAADTALESIARDSLSAPDQLSYDVFQYSIEDELRGLRFEWEVLPITQLNGVHQDVPLMLDLMPGGTLEEAEDVLERLRGIPRLVDQTLVLLQRGLESRITMPKVTLRDVPGNFEALLVSDLEKNPLGVKFRSLPASLPEPARERLRKDALRVLEAEVIPAYRKLRQFLVDEYIPRARESIAWTALPDGAPWYQFLIRHHTTTKKSAKEIHEIGTAEVKRIRAEMAALIAETPYAGDFEGFTKFLRDDASFYYQKREDLIEGYRQVARGIDARLPELFRTLPRTPYEIAAVPSFSERSQPAAYYEPGSPKTKRPGRFFANTYALSERPKWEMEALTAHEAVPGHHLQVSLAQELEGLPEFRKFVWSTAYSEGWGLYAESLGDQLGLYKDRYSRFGRSSGELWRAIRLVVDTGMHALGWSRREAIDYAIEQSGRAEHDVIVEVDRYIVWPAQALAYKIGELEIKGLRERAKQKLGARFDVREFHDVVLRDGSLPLDLLEARFEQWALRAAAGTARE